MENIKNVENEIMIFENEKLGLSVRCIKIDGKEYFTASDIAKALGYTNPSKAVKDHCRYITKRSVPHPQNKEKTIEVNVIPEGDMYRLICNSKLESAEKFESWVMDEVLPSIRKEGGYISNNATEEQVIKLIEKYSFRKITKIIAETPMMLLESKIAEIYNTNLNMKKKDRDAYHKSLNKTDYKIKLKTHIRTAIEYRPMPMGIDGSVEAVIRYSIIDKLDKEILTTTRKSTSNKLAHKDKTIANLNEAIDKLSPSLDKYICIDYHALPNNKLYEYDESNYQKKTKQYQLWISKFPNRQCMNPEYWTDVDFTKPIKMYLKFVVADDRHDTNNLPKSTIDQIMNRCYGIDDNIVKDTLCELEGYCDTYKEGKIYFYIQNI